MKKEIFLILLIFIGFESIAYAKTIEVPLLIDSSCDSTIILDTYEKVSIIGDIYNVKRTTKIFPIDMNRFCFQWFLDENNPSDIWDIETKFNGKVQNQYESGNNAVYITTSIVEWKKQDSPIGNYYTSRQPICFDLDTNTINIIEQEFKATNKVKKGLIFLDGNIIENVNLKFWFWNLDNDFWFPFDGRIIPQAPNSKAPPDKQLSIKYTGVFEYPTDFEAYGLQNAKGYSLQKKGVFIGTSPGNEQLIAEMDLGVPIQKTINVYESNNPKEPNYAIVGPICGTNKDPPHFEIKLKRAPFIFAIFYLTLILATVLLCFYCSRIFTGQKTFEFLLIIFFFQEGITQFSPVVRPLETTIFDLIIPVALASLGILFLYFKFSDLISKKAVLLSRSISHLTKRGIVFILKYAKIVYAHLRKLISEAIKYLEPLIKNK